MVRKSQGTALAKRVASLFRRQVYASIEHYETKGGQWITIGGSAGPNGERHAGGTPVKLDESGNIAAGPKGLTGKHIGQVDQDKRGDKTGDKNVPNPVHPITAAINKAVSYSDRPLKLRPPNEARNPTKGAQKPLFDRMPAETPKAAPKPGPAQLTPDQIEADPRRFQYKISGVDSKTGVTKSLDDSKKFNPLFGGQLLVWHDPKDGKTYVINGHHRLHLAKRSGYNGAMSAYYLDAQSPEHARAIGALANIAGGNGTATDAAKFMRDSGTSLEDMAQHGVSVSGAIARDAVPLARLHPDLFQKLTNGLIDERRALAISRHVSRPEHQKQLADIVDKREAKTNKRLSNSTIEEMGKEMELAGTRKQKGTDLFGDFEDEKSNFVERGEIRGHIRKQLAEDKNAFRAVAKKKRNSRLEEAGNILDTEANAQHADNAAKAMAVFDQLSNLKGPLADSLNKAAEDYGTNPKKRKSIFDSVYKQALAHIRAELGEPQSAGESDMDTPETKPAGQESLAYSRGQHAAGGSSRATSGPDLVAMFRHFMGAAVATEQYAKPKPMAGQKSMQWDEDKHPRDHGKFASKPGAQGEEEEGGGKANASQTASTLSVLAEDDSDKADKAKGSPEAAALHAKAAASNKKAAAAHLEAHKAGFQAHPDLRGHHATLSWRHDTAAAHHESLAGGSTPFALANKPEKPAAPPAPPTTGGKQGALFGKSGKPGQMNLFADKGVPKELTAKPSAGDMAAAMARGDDHSEHLSRFANAAKEAGMEGEEATAHAIASIEKHYPPANPQGADTQTRHKTAGGEYTPQRKMLHERIVGHVLHGVGTGHQAPEMHFMGGGPASGKSTVINSGQVQLPEGHALIDPDEIKGQIPEYQAGSHLRDSKAAAYAHEESSDLAGKVRDTAMGNKSHIVVDGTGDSGYAKMAAKVEAAKAKGYKAVAHYVTVGTDEAVRRAMARAEKTGRMVPESVIRDTHRAVSQIVPEAIKNGLFHELAVYDTETDEGGQPIKIAEARGTQLTVHHPERWKKFLDKGNV